MKMTKAEAINEIEFLIKGYTDMTGCERIKKACEMAKEALEEQQAEIEWNNAKYEVHSKIGQTVYLGFGCSNCGTFSQVKSRFCRECGGRYDGNVKKDKADKHTFVFGGF